MKKLSIIYIVLFLFLVSCDEEPSAPQVTAPEVQSVSPTTGTIGTKVALTIIGSGFSETTVTSDDDDLILADPVSSDTEIKITATISAEAFSKTVNLILFNTEGTDSVSFSFTPASLEGLVWSTVQDIPTPRSGLSVAAVDGKIYAMGGIIGRDSVVATMEVYDPSMNTWTTGVDMTNPIAFAASSVIDGKIYVAGGFDFETHSSALNVFDPSTNTWTNLTDIPAPRALAEGAALDGIFYFGGGVYDFFIVDNLWSYNVAVASWSILASMPRVKSSFGMVADNDRIYAIGGEGENNPGANLYYTPSTNSWSTITNIPTPRTSPMADNFLGNVIIIGGITADNTTEHTILVFSSTVESLNPVTNSWSTLIDIPDARDRGGAAVIGKKIYIVGGRNRIDGVNVAIASTLVGEIP